MRRPSPAIAVSMAAVVIALSGTAYAAGGKSLILGHKNTATATTSLKDAKGTPLALTAPAGKPPLSVSNSKQISRLNATLLQGKTPAQFGAVESARITNVPGESGCTEASNCFTPYFGAISGTSSPTTTQGDVDSLSPDQPMVIRNLSVVATTAPGDDNVLQVGVSVNDSGGAVLTCLIEGSQTGCHDGTHAVTVAAGSRMSITVIHNQAPGSPGFPGTDVLVGFTMSPA
jgi:hypothetical protein